MKASVTIGDVFEHQADVLICPANPWLNLSGGVNGEILQRCGTPIQEELHNHLDKTGRKHLLPGSTAVTSAYGLNFKKIVHSVAIDAFYDTDKQIVTNALVESWRTASVYGATVCMPSVATGYGRLPFNDFASSFHSAISTLQEIDIDVLLVLRNQENLDAFRLFNPNVIHVA